MVLPERKRSRRYRDRLRAAGLRPVEIWIPDTSLPGFSEKLRAQVALLRGQSEEEEALNFLEALGVDEELS